MYGKIKTDLFRKLGSNVIEIGAGTGANFRYLENDATVHVVEPNPYCKSELMKVSSKLGLSIRIHEVGAENLPVADGFASSIICSLVLCSVNDPALVLQEIRRCLAPGGRFIFIEHVRSKNVLRRCYQYCFAPFWRLTFGGCRLTRDTRSLIEQAGFEHLKVNSTGIGNFLLPFRPHIYGFAVKSD